MELENLKKLFIHHAKDLYNAESQVQKLVDELVSEARNEDLKDIFRKQGEMVQENIGALKKVADELNFNLQGEKCYAMEGIVREAKEFIKEEADADVKDAGLIADAHRVAHYFIAGYGTISRWAQQMKLSDEVRDNCKSCVANAEDIDKKLSAIAEKKINKEAMQS